MKRLENIMEKARKSIYALPVLLSLMLAVCCPMSVKAANENIYTFSYISGDVKYELSYASNKPCVLHYNMGTNGISHLDSAPKVKLYSLDANETGIKQVYPTILNQYKWDDTTREWKIDESYVPGTRTYTYDFANGNLSRLELTDSGLKILVLPSVNEVNSAILSYLKNGSISSELAVENYYALNSANALPLVCLQYSPSANGIQRYIRTEDKSLKIDMASIDKDGVITYSLPSYPEETITKGISIDFYDSKGGYNVAFYNYPLLPGKKIKTHFNNYSNNEYLIRGINLTPYYVDMAGRPHIGASYSLTIDNTAEYYTRADDSARMFTMDDPLDIDTGKLPGSDDSFIGDSGGNGDASHGGGGLRKDDFNGGNSIFIDPDTVINSVGESDVVINEVVDMPSMKLNNVSFDTIGSYITIKWNGVTTPGELLFVPDNATLVTCTCIYYDSDLKRYVYDCLPKKTIRIRDNKLTFNLSKLFDHFKNTGYQWDGDLYLAPSFYRTDKDGLTRYYIGDVVVIDITENTVNDIYTDSSGNEIKDVISDNKGQDELNSFEMDLSDTTAYLSQFGSIIKTVISGIGALPALLSSVFSFLPNTYMTLIYLILITVFILRIVGR